jgi:hypothetical protein
VEQELDKRQQLAALLAAPEKVSAADALLLRESAALYPYFQPLHLLLAKATQHEPAKYKQLATASLYTRGPILHDILNRSVPFNPGSFHIVESRPAASSITPQIELSTASVTDELVMENIAATDFFAFQENFTVETKSPEAEQVVTNPENVVSEEVIAEPGLAEPVVVSKYDDDQLPYTFLWWLAKTRKEYQQIFQPYASPRKDAEPAAAQTPARTVPGELQHQYVEHIFHLQSPFTETEEDGYTTEGFRKQGKGADLIESFIKNDPQISPPKPEQIDNENKAKKSAEDHNDLVSETLAKIYIEQMLYDKAIETYQKLSLKFPEKSRYFADLIQSIEKKI